MTSTSAVSWTSGQIQLHKRDALLDPQFDNQPLVGGEGVPVRDNRAQRGNHRRELVRRGDRLQPRHRVSPRLNVQDFFSRPATIRKATSRRKTRIASLLVAFFAVSGTAQANPSPIYWTPLKMSKALVALGYPQGAQPIFRTVCRGTTKPHKGTFAAFRCLVTYYGHTTATVWAKPLAHGRVCGSTSGLASCKPLAAGPLAGDPRACDGTTSDDCIAVNARAAAAAHWKAQTGYSQPAPRCTASSQFVYVCVAGQPPGQTWTYTVTFTKGATAWVTTVTP